MNILIYQIIIFFTIYVLGLFGKNARNATTIAISIFTLLMVFTTWLSILQFITIFIAYYFSVIQEEKAIQKKLIRKEQGVYRKSDKNNNSYYYFFLIVLAIICAFSVTMSKKELYNQPIKENLESKKIENSNLYAPAYDTTYSTTDNTHNEELSDYDSTDVDNYNSPTNENDEDDDPYSNEDNYSIISYVEYEFAKNINENEIENGSVFLKNFNTDEFYFKLKVNNRYSTGEISGIATFLDETTAVFNNVNCKALYFQFLEDKQIRITENNCLDYHGNRIGFDGIFTQ